MKMTVRIARLLVVGAIVLGPVAALASDEVRAVPELDPSMLIGGLALAGGAVALVVERFRNRKK